MASSLTVLNAFKYMEKTFKSSPCPKLTILKSDEKRKEKLMTYVKYLYYIEGSLTIPR